MVLLVSCVCQLDNLLSFGGRGRRLSCILPSRRSQRLSALSVDMVNPHNAGPTGQDEDTSVLVGLRESLKQVLLENKLLEQEISSVKGLSVSVARWLVQGSGVEVRPVCRQPNPDSEDADVAPEMPAQLEAQPRSKRSRHE